MPGLPPKFSWLESFIDFIMKKIILASVLIFLFLSTYCQKNKRTVNPPHQVQLPYDRILQPAGTQIYFGDTTLEYHALDAALSPNQKWLVVEDRYTVFFVRTSDLKICYTLTYKDSLAKSMNTYSGIRWYQKDDSLNVLWSCVDSSDRSFVVMAHWNGTEAKITKLFQYKARNKADMALPNELLVKNENGKTYLYVVLNGNNQLVKQDIETGHTIWISDTGVAPYGIAEAHGKLYVTNWAGRIPDANDKYIAGVPWGEARIDTTTAAVREGSVSVFDPKTGKLLKEIVVGLHPNEIVADKPGNFVYITNSNSDMVSVINTISDEISENISLRLDGSKNKYFGDSPDGLTISDDGKTMFAANGLDNAVAMVSLGKKSSIGGKAEKSKVLGFIPTGAYPSSISITKDKKLFITNLEGEGATLPVLGKGLQAPAYNSHKMLATLSVVDWPDNSKLKEYTQTVIAVNQLSRLKTTQLSPRKGVQPKPVPERIGEPSVFKHVLYIIRENRTYDQVLGDMKQGNGDTSLCVFGEKITPNVHKLAGEFGLLDNFFVSGKCSAEGHQWTDASIVTDYIEKNVRAWFRSYPHVQTDALVYAPTGFLWDNARNHGKSVKIYGEASTPVFDPSAKWTDFYTAFLNGTPLPFKNTSTLSTVEKILSPDFPAYDHKIPDVQRADAFINDLKTYESMEGDQLPELMIMALGSDHTAGTRPGYPTPRAMVADNDVALGRIIEAVSKSRFWKNTLIISVEDDSQAGWDHVSAYRTVALMVSPYSKRNQTNHDAYNQPSIVRTIEQILGLPPMNIQDAIAVPMFSCFTGEYDPTPYTAVPNNIPLDEMNPPLTALQGKALHYAKQSLEPQFDGIDTGDDDVLNHILWFAMKGAQPYPKKFAGIDED